MAKQRREFEIQDTSIRAVKHQVMGRTSLSLPLGIQFWKPKAERYMIEFIPYRVTDSILRYPDNNRYSAPGKWYYERTYFTHRNIGVNNDSYVCPAKTFGKRCPICEEVSRLSRSSDKFDQQRVKDLRPSERQLFLIHDPDDRNNKGVYLWDISTFNFGKQLDAYINGAREQDLQAFRAFYHPYDGFSVRLSGEERPMPQGKNTVFNIIGFYDREEDLPEDILDHGYDLDTMPRELSYDALNHIFTGTADADEVDGDTGQEQREERPARRVSRNDDDDAPRRPAPRDEDLVAPRESRRREESRPEPEPRRKPDPEPPPPPKKPEPVEFATNDTVSFDFKGNMVTGTVKKVMHEEGIAYIEVPGMDRHKIIDLTELKLVKADDTFDLKNPPPDVKSKEPVRSAPGKWDDGDGEEAPPVKRGPGRPPKPRS